MKLRDTMIAWNSLDRGGEIEVGPMPGPDADYRLKDWTDRYDRTGGFCYTDRRSLNTDQAIAMMFVDFNQLVVGDRLDPKKVHAEFMKIDEYRKMIPEDFPGADPDGGFAGCHSIQGS